MGSFTLGPGLWRASISELAWAHLSPSWAVSSSIHRTKHLLSPEHEPERCRCLHGKGLAEPGARCPDKKSPCGWACAQLGAAKRQEPWWGNTKINPSTEDAGTLCSNTAFLPGEDSGRWWFPMAAQLLLAGETGGILGRWAVSAKKDLFYKRLGFLKNSKNNNISLSSTGLYYNCYYHCSWTVDFHFGLIFFLIRLTMHSWPCAFFFPL